GRAGEQSPQDGRTMTLRQLAGFALALGGLTAFPGTAPAAWDNVFQVCCHDCGGTPRASYYAPPCPTPCPQPCPQPEMRISYVQRSYYQPVTEYVSRKFYERCT